MNKKILLWVGIVVVLVIVVLVIVNKKSTDVPAVTEITTTESSSTQTPTETVNSAVTPAKTSSSMNGTVAPATAPVAPTGPKTFTLTQVATHNSEPDCYSAINGKVYNLTAWISEHPGGDRSILSICGKDGSAAFDSQHGGESRPERILAGFEIGILVN